MANQEWVDVNVGRLPREQAANIAREIRYLWHNLENVYPGGDKNKRAQLKVTIDRYEQYHFHINQQALLFILLFAKDIPNPAWEGFKLSGRDKGAKVTDCPPEVPDCLRWDKPGDSKPE